MSWVGLPVVSVLINKAFSGLYNFVVIFYTAISGQPMPIDFGSSYYQCLFGEAKRQIVVFI